MARRRATGAAVVVLIAALAGPACAADREQSRTSDPGRPSTTVTRTTRPIPTTTLPDLTASGGVAASIRQFREDEVADVIQVELVREPSASITDLMRVHSVQLHWPGFAAVPPVAREVTLAAGQRVDIPTPMGEAVCAATTTPTFALGTVTVAMTMPDGTDRQVAAPLLADAQAALDNAWGKACVRRRLVERVGLAYGSWSRSDPNGIPTASGTIVVRRGNTDEQISVTGVDGSVLLFLNPASTLRDAVLPPSGASTEIPIVVTGAGRCDGHALSDSKKTYVFQVLVQVGDDEPVGIDVPVPDAGRPLLNQVIVDTCGSDHHR